MARGPVLLIPGREVHVGIKKALKMSQFNSKDQAMFGDLHACIAALPMAIQNNASEIVIEVEGERPRRHKVKTAIEHLERDWWRLAVYLKGFGNVEDPKFGINVAPGHHVSHLELRAEAAARREKQRHKAAGGLILAA